MNRDFRNKHGDVKGKTLQCRRDKMCQVGAIARPEDGAAAVEAESFIWQIAMSFHQRWSGRSRAQGRIGI